MADLIEGLIREGDVAVIRGDPAFFEALKAFAGDRARAVVNVDLETRPDLYLASDYEGGLELSFPKEPRRAPVNIPDGKPDPTPLLIYAYDRARNGPHLCKLAPVILDGVSPTFARVLKAGGEEVWELGLHLIDGKAVTSRLSRGSV